MRRMRLAVAALIVGMLAATATPAADAFWAQVTFLKGTVAFIKAASQAEVPLKRGAVLHKGDTVKTADGAQASLLLNDGSVLVVRSATQMVLGKAEKGAAPSLPTLAKNFSKAMLSRDGDNPMLKHLGGLRGEGRNAAIAPCRTKVKADGLKLLWSRVPGVSRYAVTLMGPDDSLFESTVGETSLSVPAEKLAAGATYYWEVRDAASRDSILALGSGTFSTLEKKAEDEVKGLEGSIGAAFPQAGQEEDSTPLFLTYQLYRERGLSLDALRILERMAKLNPQDGEIAKWRQDLFKEMGLEERDAAALASALP